MKAIFVFVCAFILLNGIYSFDVGVSDAENKYYFNSTLSLSIKVKNGSEASEQVAISNATATLADSRVDGRSVFYTFTVNPVQSSFVSKLNLTIQTQRSGDGGRRYVEEFELTVVFDSSMRQRNLSDIPLTFLVRPPRFPHFQVKIDWQYRCPKNLTLGLCHLANGTTSCSSESPYDLVQVDMWLMDTIFNGGMDPSHDYSAKMEECPLAYQTRQDVGIACIATFWTIALAAVLWGGIKYLMKRHKARND